MNTDLSVAPEIAQLADPFVPSRHAVAVPRTDGRIAGDLADLAAAPQRWWDLVRFDHDGPVRIPLPDAPGAWLLVLPPGATIDCDCRQATALAGEAVETAIRTESVAAAGAGATEEAAGQAQAVGGTARSDSGAPPRPLRPGRVRVHGTRAAHRMHAAGLGYSVTLHVLLAGGRPVLVRAAPGPGHLVMSSPLGFAAAMGWARRKLDVQLDPFHERHIPPFHGGKARNIQARYSG